MNYISTTMAPLKKRQDIALTKTEVMCIIHRELFLHHRQMLINGYPLIAIYSHDTGERYYSDDEGYEPIGIAEFSNSCMFVYLAYNNPRYLEIGDKAECKSWMDHQGQAIGIEVIQGRHQWEVQFTDIVSFGLAFASED